MQWEFLLIRVKQLAQNVCMNHRGIPLPHPWG